MIEREIRRPWGHMDVFAENEPCTVKLVTIEPGESLSLQFHNNRSQLYIPLDNVFMEWSDEPVPIELTDPSIILRWYDDHFDCGFNVKRLFERRVIHRARTITRSRVGQFFEVAFGHNDEEDIVRLEDKYGRASVGGRCAL